MGRAGRHGRSLGRYSRCRMVRPAVDALRQKSNSAGANINAERPLLIRVLPVGRSGA